jgi:hypothetical protein
LSSGYGQTIAKSVRMIQREAFVLAMCRFKKMKKQISKKVASQKYGIIVKRYHDYKYYLLDNGSVVDSDGCVRYIPQPKIYEAKI